MGFVSFGVGQSFVSGYAILFALKMLCPTKYMGTTNMFLFSCVCGFFFFLHFQYGVG